MSDDLVKKVKENIIKNNLILKGEKILIMISGGGDSVGLFYVLNELKKELDFEIVFFHLNHKIRKEAICDAKLVENIAKSENIKFYYFEEDIIKIAEKNNLSVEEAGREMRYKLAFDVMKKEGCGKIATAHHIADNAESVLLNLIRGSGVKGVCSIENKNERIIRPFINIKKEEILSFLKEKNIEYATDLTNFDTNYTRNFVRGEIIPKLNEVNERAVEHILNFSRTQSLAYDLINSLADEVKINKKDKYVSVNVPDLEDKKEIVKRQIVLNMIEKAGLKKNIKYSQIENIINLLNNKTTFDINLNNGYTIKRRYDKLMVIKDEKKENKDFLYTLDIKNLKENKEYLIENNLFILKFLKINKNNFKKRNVKYIDCGKIQGNITIRNRLAQDKFSPFGLKGKKSVKKYFIEKKIPKEKRHSIPIILEGDNIIYVGGEEISEKYKVDKSTKNILVIDYIEKE